jgi:predicted dinucleotide-binding enzyme
VPWAAVPETLAAAGPLSGKLLIDCTNPTSPDFLDLLVGHTSSGAEEIAARVGTATVIKAFNHLNARLLHAAPSRDRPSVFLCGGDPAARALVARLAHDAGGAPVDAGPLRNARLLEPMAALVLQLAYVLGLGSEVALRVVGQAADVGQPLSG